MELLKKLTDINSPSGNEEKIRDFIINEISEYADECKADSIGNIIVHKKGKGKKLVISAHMDEVGFLAMIIDENGYVRPRKIGDVNLLTLRNTKVVFDNNAIGIVNSKSSKRIEKEGKITDFYIDVLDKCKVKELNPYDTATFISDCYENDEFISSKALGSRSGCYTLIRLIKEINESPFDLYFIFSVQGEIGFHCLKTAIYSIQPDFAINLDSVNCVDFNKENNELKLAGGPVIKIMDKDIICNPVIRNALSEKAKKQNISIQYEISNKSKSDTGSISTSGTGVITGAICIPCRNLHCPNEVISKSDISDTVKILKSICEEGF